MGKPDHVFRSDRLLELQGDRSQQEFASRLGINQSQLQKYLSGRTEPTAAVVARMSRGAGVSSDWLLGLSDDRHGQMPPLSSEEMAFLEAAKQGLNVDALLALVAFLEGLNK